MTQPSLLRTHVGLGVIELDHQGAPVPATSARTRFVVTPGPRPGQLLLTAVAEGTELDRDALVVSLAAEGGIDERRLARALIGVR
jgi:hypothetical protein